MLRIAVRPSQSKRGLKRRKAKAGRRDRLRKGDGANHAFDVCGVVLGRCDLTHNRVDGKVARA